MWGFVKYWWVCITWIRCATVPGCVQCCTSRHLKDGRWTAVCKITEWCPLRGSSGDHLVQPPPQNRVKFEVRSGCSGWCPGKVCVPPRMSPQICLQAPASVHAHSRRASLSLPVLPIFHPINHPLIQASFHQFGFDHIMGNCQRSFKGRSTQHPLLSLIQSQGGNQVGQGCFVFGKSMLDVQMTFLSVLCLDSALQGLRLSWLAYGSPDPASGPAWKWM